MSLALSAFVWLKDAWLVVIITSGFVAIFLTGSAGMLASVNEVGCLSNYLILACSFFLFFFLFFCWRTVWPEKACSLGHLQPHCVSCSFLCFNSFVLRHLHSTWTWKLGWTPHFMRLMFWAHYHLVLFIFAYLFHLIAQNIMSLL